VSQEQTRSLLLVVLGAMAVWLWRSGQALNYVRPGLVPLVGVAGLVLLAGGLLPPLGLLGTGRAGHRPDSLGDPGGHQGQHQHGGRVGWLLLVPVLVVILIQPAALGSYAVSSRTVVPGAGDSGFPPLAAPVRGAVPMTMAEFVTRAVRDPDQSLAGVRVRLTGFVAPAEHDGSSSYRLTRFVIFCCAADAEALQVAVHGDPTPRTRDQWLEVEGIWAPRAIPPDDGRTPSPPVLNVNLVRPVGQPRPPYEYTVQFNG
jgi:uncharacterized repeat protein (TIGR03943 family)